MTFKTLLLTSALLTSTTPAFAQAVRPTPVGPAALEEVVVTGRRNGADLALGAPATFLETPASVSTVQTATLLEHGGTTLLDALRNVPGAQADLSFVGSHSQVVVLRGSIADSGTQSSRILRDGVRLSNYAFTPAFVDQINVLRGPGAAASTRSEPGGTVELVTKSAQLSDFGLAYARIGQNEARETWIDVNRVLSREHGLAVRLILVSSAEDEWRHVKDRLDGLKLGLSKSEGDRYRVSLEVEATNQTYNPDFGLPALNGSVVDVPRDRQLGEPFADSETDNRVYSLHGDYRLPLGRVALDYTHMDSHMVSIRNSVFSVAAGQPFGTFNRATAYEPDGRREIDSVALSWTGKVATGQVTHNLYAGAESYTETLDLPSLSVPAINTARINVFNPVYGLNTAPTGTLNRTLTGQDTQSTLLTVQDRMEIGRLGFVAGLQYVDLDSTYGVVGVAKPVTESRVTPRLGLTYALSDSQTLYGSYSGGSAFQPVLQTSGESVPLRHSEQYEIGWKFDDGGRLRADIALYQLDHDNLISGDPAVFGRFLVGGKARSKGVEVSAAGQVTERLSVTLAYAYTDAQYRDGALYPGKQIPNVAQHSGSLFAQMRWTPQWRTGLGLYAQSERFADGPNATRLPGYVRLDAVQAYSFSLNNRPLELQFNIENLLDEDYFAGSHVHVSRYILPGQGRNASVSLSYRF
ncbi:iron complex outermembrane receptor protein [Brevundimonas vesicularis]|uniref:TonB-dependent receptor n=1 Tax=Brevundimonas vesicularis TaxID=41276 RepID=UPI0027824AED|nr:TonB-dependent siderophore receptor [Brevundimonas vesicularis]MDQ1192753.1 iron complex outermembrane receptor protein [Brevundimonas vesicularis]